MEFRGATDDYASLQNAFDAKGGDCTTYKSENDEAVYVPCAHVIPEMWSKKQTC